MKFKKKKRKVDVPWEDGAILKLDVAYFQDVIAGAKSIKDSALTLDLIEKSIIGWEGIIGDDDKPLKFSEEMKKEIIDRIMEDNTVVKKLIAAVKGPEGNSTAGSTSQ